MPVAQLQEGEHSAAPASLSHDASSAKQYWLPSHLQICSTATGAVLLDLERNRYLGIGRIEARALLALAKNCPEPDSQAMDASDPIPTAEMERIAQSLFKAGLLSRDAPTDTGYAKGEIDLRSTMTSVGHELDRSIAIRFGHTIAFLRACWWARRAVRARTLYSVAREISNNKRQFLEPFDSQRAIELVCIFRRLRPLAFTAQDQCLFHALALVRFLSCYRIYPAWVIGVRARPWAAHSWVQQGSLLLDSNPEHVYEYTPILIV